jgi:MoaA/NifB/PqqE/SkfB family radical SAM enzyme
MDRGIILREAISVCPICYKEIKAQVIEKNSEIFLEKHCYQHGEYRILLSRTPDYFKTLREISSAYACKAKRKKQTEITLTFRCNMNCPICFWKDPEQRFFGGEPTLKEIEEIITDKSKATWRFILSGGEPTLREDLFQIIKILKRHKKSVIINTNGIKLADIDYARKLKKYGVDRISIQLDGFDENLERCFRGDNYLPIKMQALNNLKELKMTVGINATIWRGMEEQISKLLNFAIENRFIKSIGLTTLLYSGGAREFPLNRYMLSDEAVDILEIQTKGKISKRSVIIFTKLFLIMAIFFEKAWCRYVYVYLLIRKGKTCEPIDRYIDLQKIDPYLDRFYRLYSENKFKGRLFFLLILPVILFIHTKSLNLTKELIFKSISFFMGKEKYLNPLDMLYIEIGSRCDIYNLENVKGECCYNVLLKDGDKILHRTNRSISARIL